MSSAGYSVNVMKSCFFYTAVHFTDSSKLRADKRHLSTQEGQNAVDRQHHELGQMRSSCLKRREVPIIERRRILFIDTPESVFVSCSINIPINIFRILAAIAEDSTAETPFVLKSCIRMIACKEDIGRCRGDQREKLAHSSLLCYLVKESGPDLRTFPGAQSHEIAGIRLIPEALRRFSFCLAQSVAISYPNQIT